MWGNRCQGLYTLQNPYKFTAIFVYEECRKSAIGNKGKLFSRYFQKIIIGLPADEAIVSIPLCQQSRGDCTNHEKACN